MANRIVIPDPKTIGLIVNKKEKQIIKCYDCGCILNKSTGLHKIKDGYICDNCYCDGFGRK